MFAKNKLRKNKITNLDGNRDRFEYYIDILGSILDHKVLSEIG